MEDLKKARYGTQDPQDEVPSPDTEDLIEMFDADPNSDPKELRDRWYNEACTSLAEDEMESMQAYEDGPREY